MLEKGYIVGRKTFSYGFKYGNMYHGRQQVWKKEITSLDNPWSGLGTRCQ